MTPPGIRPVFDHNTQWAKARLIAYEQVRQIEDAELLCQMQGG